MSVANSRETEQNGRKSFNDIAMRCIWILKRRGKYKRRELRSAKEKETDISRIKDGLQRLPLIKDGLEAKCGIDCAKTRFYVLSTKWRQNSNATALKKWPVQPHEMEAQMRMDLFG